MTVSRLIENAERVVEWAHLNGMDLAGALRLDPDEDADTLDLIDDALSVAHEYLALCAEVRRLTEQKDEAQAELSKVVSALPGLPHGRSVVQYAQDVASEAARLREALADFRDKGLRYDLTPTRISPATVADEYMWWVHYITRADSGVRERASSALSVVRAEGNEADRG